MTVPVQDGKNPTDLSIVPEAMVANVDDTVEQSTILTEIIGTKAFDYESFEEKFNKMEENRLMLSKLKAMYESKDKNAVNRLSTRNTIEIDEEFKLDLSAGQARMDTKESMIDYHLTVANRIGFSSLLPNASSDHRFSFQMDLKAPYRSFKGKHAMLGFDPAGSILFIGQCNNEDVFLAMAPNGFLRGDRETERSPPGHGSASPLMSKRHYRQMVMMIAHFLAKLPERSYYNHGNIYDLKLDTAKANFEDVTETL